MEEPIQPASRRRYRSALRSQQATATRDRVLRAARQAFADSGYPNATIEAIAGAAGVAVPTVYWQFGTKQQLLRAVLDGIGRTVGLEARIRQILTAEDSREQLRLTAALSRELWGESAAVLRGIAQSRGADPAFDGWLRTLDDERRTGELRLIVACSQRGDLRADLTIDEGADLLLVLSGPGLYLELVDGRGWSPSRYEAWLAGSLQESLLAPNPSSRLDGRRDER